MKKGLRNGVTVLAFSALLPLSSLQAKVVDGVAAVVGDDIILRSEVEEQALLTEYQYPEAKGDDELRSRILQNLVTRKILLQKAVLDSVTVNESEIVQQTEERLAFLRSRFSSVDEMERRFSKPYVLIEKEIREDIRNQQLVDNLRQMRMSEVTVNYDEVKAFYQENRASLPIVPESVEVSQIIMYPGVSEESRQSAREKIATIQSRLDEGADFTALAREYSEDPGSAAVGGDLGYSRRGEFVRPFEEAVFSLEEGAVSDIVETRFGYHLIQLLEKKGDTVHPRHILIVFDRSSLDREASRKKLEDIRQAVLDGEASFAAMAATWSEDPRSAASGGVIRQGGSGESFFPVESLKEPLKGVVESLKEDGDISMPLWIEPEGGAPFYALFRLQERRAEHRMALDTDYARLEQMAVDRKQQEKFAEWVDSLRREVYVELDASDI